MPREVPPAPLALSPLRRNRLVDRDTLVPKESATVAAREVITSVICQYPNS